MADFIVPPKNTASPFADMRGHHVAVRAPSLAEAKEFYVETLDFRIIAEWDYAGERLAYLAPPTDDHFCIEVLGDGNARPTDVRPYTDLGDSLKYSGYANYGRLHARVAATLPDVVELYNTRFSIGLNAQERSDLVAFLRAL